MWSGDHAPLNLTRLGDPGRVEHPQSAKFSEVDGSPLFNLWRRAGSRHGCRESAWSEDVESVVRDNAAAFKIFPFAEPEEAMAYLETGRAKGRLVGKLVLTMR